MTRNDVTFSVIIPTTGRRSLRRTFASLSDQLEPGDEVLLLWNRDGDYGNRARQSLMERARGTHVVFMDDDDQYAPGAFAAMRSFAREQPNRVGIFRLRYLDGRLLWKDPLIRRANVSTQLFCVPNVPGQLADWTEPVTDGDEILPAYYADFGFVTRTVALQGPAEFRPEVVALIRADRRRWVRAVQRIVRPFESAWIKVRRR